MQRIRRFRQHRICVLAALLIAAASQAVAWEYCNISITSPPNPMYVIQGQTIIVHYDWWEDPDNPAINAQYISLNVSHDVGSECYWLAMNSTEIVEIGDGHTPIPNPSSGDFVWNTAGFEGAYYIYIHTANCMYLPDGSLFTCNCPTWQHADQVTVLLVPPTPVLSGPADPVNAGVDYTLTWNYMVASTGYELQESTSPSFSDVTTFAIEGIGTLSFSLHHSPPTPVTFHYRVRAVHSGAGVTGAWSPEVVVRVKAVPSGVESAVSAPPSGFELAGCFPNPFNPSTTVRFGLRDASSVKLEVLNPRGQKVRTLMRRTLDPGEHSVSWDGLDDRGQDAGTGVFICLLTDGKQVLTGKMLKLK